MRVKRIAIIGLGLIGGSLALALKQALGNAITITGLDRQPQSLASALKLGAIDVCVQQAEELGQQDVVFVCIPVLHIVPTIDKLLRYLQPGTIISDVGSTKTYILQRLQGSLPSHIKYIGGHPIAGREKSGISAADSNLFKGKWYIFTQGINATPDDYHAVAELIQATGARTTRMDGFEHDRYAAYMSHAPHVAAAALVNALEGINCQENLLKLMGGGFRDTTRIASSDADMWADICLSNSEAIIQSLKQYQQILAQVVTSIEKQDRAQLHNYFCDSKTRRDTMLAREVVTG